MPPWCESILGYKVEAVPGNRFPWNGLRHLGDSGNGGTTLEFLSPSLWRAPPLEMRWESREFFPYHAGKGSLLSRSMSTLERNPTIPVPTPHKDLVTSIDGRGIPRGPQATPMGTGLSSSHQSGSLRSPSQVQSTCSNLRKSRRFSLPGEMRTISAEVSQC